MTFPKPLLPSARKVGIPGVSENIEVRSIVGRFLEHSRIFRFENGGEPKIYLGSADWMPRNLFRRVETAFPITSPGMREHVEEIMDWYWRDNTKAKVMQPDGTYQAREATGLPFDAQAEFVADAQRRRKRKVAVPVVLGARRRTPPQAAKRSRAKPSRNAPDISSSGKLQVEAVPYGRLVR